MTVGCCPADCRLWYYTDDIITTAFLPSLISSLLSWLPGLVSQSVILWDRIGLEWSRIVKGRLTISLFEILDQPDIPALMLHSVKENPRSIG